MVVTENPADGSPPTFGGLQGPPTLIFSISVESFSRGSCILWRFFSLQRMNIKRSILTRIYYLKGYYISDK